MRETGFSHLPTGAHLLFILLFIFKDTALSRYTRGSYLHVDVMSVQLPPLDTHNQIWKQSTGRCEIFLLCTWRFAFIQQNNQQP